VSHEKAEGRPIDVTCGLIEGSGRLLVAQRPPGKALAGKWEFPGGKVEPGEVPAACLARELREELGVEVRVGEPLPPCLHRYGDRTIRLLPFRCEIVAGALRAHEHTAVRWCTLEEIAALELAAADVPVLAHYRAVVASIPSRAP
jgi:8-oxo-dGTP diphosphatase